MPKLSSCPAQASHLAGEHDAACARGSRQAGHSCHYLATRRLAVERALAGDDEIRPGDPLPEAGLAQHELDAALPAAAEDEKAVAEAAGGAGAGQQLEACGTGNLAADDLGQPP